MSKYIIPFALGNGLQYPIGDNMPEALAHIKNVANKFKSLALPKGKDLNIFCRGSSGAILAALFIQSIPNKARIVHVKKSGEYSHGTSSAWDKDENTLNIIIDDFIDSGDTLNAIYSEFESRSYCGNEIDYLIIENGTDARMDNLRFKPNNLITCR